MGAIVWGELNEKAGWTQPYAKWVWILKKLQNIYFPFPMEKKKFFLILTAEDLF